MRTGSRNKEQRGRSVERAKKCIGTGSQVNRREDGGYSIVELIIVVAIIAAVIAVAGYSIVMIFSANAKACANDLQRAFTDCKVTTMGKAEAYLELYGQDGCVYSLMTVDGKTGEPQKVGTNRVSVTCEKDGAETKDISGGEKIKIVYDRSAGSFADAKMDDFDTIVIAGGGRTYELKLIRLTGKTELTLR